MKLTTSKAILLTLALSLLLSACGSLAFKSEELPSPPEPIAAGTTPSVKRFGALIRSYPVRLRTPLLIEVPRLPNTSGVKEGLPDTLAPVVATTLQRIGSPVEVREINNEERLMRATESQFSRNRSLSRPQAELILRGSVTEGEPTLRKGFSVEMDLLVRGSSRGDSSRSRDGDFGLGMDRELEVTTLAIDLHLVDALTDIGIDQLAEVVRVNVVRHDRSTSYGLFFDGSGLGFRSRAVAAQSKSHALRIASEVAIIRLLGGYLRIPWWRAIEGALPDEELIGQYRTFLEEQGDISVFLKLLLFAHGEEVDLGTSSLTESERLAAVRLKNEMGLAPETTTLDFLVRLWEAVPKEAQTRMQWLRRQPPAGSQPVSVVLRIIEALREGKIFRLSIPFGYARSDLTDEARNSLGIVLEAIRHPDFPLEWRLELLGHSDERGSPSKLLELSKKRVARVSGYLAGQGIPQGLMTSEGFGASKPVHEKADSELEHAANRRVEVYILPPGVED